MDRPPTRLRADAFRVPVGRIERRTRLIDLKVGDVGRRSVLLELGGDPGFFGVAAIVGLARRPEGESGVAVGRALRNAHAARMPVSTSIAVEGEDDVHAVLRDLRQEMPPTCLYRVSHVQDDLDGPTVLLESEGMRSRLLQRLSGLSDDGDHVVGVVRAAGLLPGLWLGGESMDLVDRLDPNPPDRDRVLVVADAETSSGDPPSVREDVADEIAGWNGRVVVLGSDAIPDPIGDAVRRRSERRPDGIETIVVGGREPEAFEDAVRDWLRRTPVVPESCVVTSPARDVAERVSGTLGGRGVESEVGPRVPGSDYDDAGAEVAI